MGLFTKKKPFPEAAGQKSPEAKTSPPSSPERPTETGGAGESVYSDNTKSQKTQQSSDYHPDHDPIDEGNDEEVDEEELHKATEWDEGGKSHCGYSDSVHDTLMAVGGSVHGVVGEPNAHVEKKMNAVANWFQEMSYTIRDLWRGQHDISQDFHDVMNSVMADSGEAHMEDDDDHHKDEPGTSNDVTPNATATTS